ncbi:hypothetical protein EZS27_003919 [termite gut metagenome]|uniref:Helicase ATP-binding domain-containing protein n=1 Tax=termite gut metagenome TaxID=433724 RepID=A0A5J4SRF6_9ZZZZ
MGTYKELLASKTRRGIESGFSISIDDLNPMLFEFQKYCVRKALSKGRFCLFEECGLGKTLQQLEWANQVICHTSQPVIIIAPLAVVGQTVLEGEKFGIPVKKYEHGNERPCVYITNYEQLENIDTSLFSGVVLDESSILKNFTGAMRNLIIDRFRYTKYKLACSATPSPNDPMELGNHAEFMGVITRNEMLSMYFVHDGGDTSKWRIKGHAQDNFWEWVSSWAIMINKPSDIGFSDDGYILPDLNMIEHEIQTDKRDNGLLFNDIAVNATNFNAELRITLVNRMDKVAKIVNNSHENFIIWIKQDAEGEYLRGLIPDAIEVKGTDKSDIKEDRLIGFANNKFRTLITKPKIAQYGLNYQNCHNQIFASLDFSFESLYQAIRRSLRFGQRHTVNVWIITTDTMQNVIQNIHKKQKQFDQMQMAMVGAMRSDSKIEYKSIRQTIDIQFPCFLKNHSL